MLVCHGLKTFVMKFSHASSVISLFFMQLIWHRLTCGRSRRGVNEVTTHAGAHAHTQFLIVWNSFGLKLPSWRDLPPRNNSGFSGESQLKWCRLLLQLRYVLATEERLLFPNDTKPNGEIRCCVCASVDRSRPLMSFLTKRSSVRGFFLIKKRNNLL